MDNNQHAYGTEALEELVKCYGKSARKLRDRLTSDEDKRMVNKLWNLFGYMYGKYALPHAATIDLANAKVITEDTEG